VSKKEKKSIYDIKKKERKKDGILKKGKKK
jgi:hypothetical protein